jgi:hypothetical protein
LDEAGGGGMGFGAVCCLGGVGVGLEGAGVGDVFVCVVWVGVTISGRKRKRKGTSSLGGAVTGSVETECRSKQVSKRNNITHSLTVALVANPQLRKSVSGLKFALRGNSLSRSKSQ